MKGRRSDEYEKKLALDRKERYMSEVKDMCRQEDRKQGREIKSHMASLPYHTDLDEEKPAKEPSDYAERLNNIMKISCDLIPTHLLRAEELLSTLKDYSP